MRRLLAAAAASVVLGAAGCGGNAGGDRPRSDRLVDFSQPKPYVFSFVRQSDGAFLLTTNRGFFRIAPGGSSAQRVGSRVLTELGTSPVGKFLFVQGVGTNLFGSGHPDDESSLPPFLGLIRSEDRGRTWRVVSRLGEADLHQIRESKGRLFAFDAVTSALLVSDNGGRSFEQYATPAQLLLDFAVDPGDPGAVVASAERELFRSEDGGKSWRPAGRGAEPRLSWPRDAAIWRADRDGRVLRSDDGGEVWRAVGRVDGEPAKIEALDDTRAFVALSDGSIVETADGGKSFKDVFRP